MFKNRSNDGRLNISGLKIRKLRKAMPEKTSQRAFAYLLQLQGLDLEKNACFECVCGRTADTR